MTKKELIKAAKKLAHEQVETEAKLNEAYYGSLKKLPANYAVTKFAAKILEFAQSRLGY